MNVLKVIGVTPSSLLRQLFSAHQNVCSEDICQRVSKSAQNILLFFSHRLGGPNKISTRRDIMLAVSRLSSSGPRACICIIYTYAVVIYYTNERTDVSGSVNLLYATGAVREWNTYYKFRNKLLCVRLSSLGQDVKKSLSPRPFRRQKYTQRLYNSNIRSARLIIIFHYF